ncbi:BppU family phage baseplate upper protein [Bacillus mycoides]|uniref:BppU family phage baseplate upper protein n=1 Tax=Bacillus mycoides TaxID=1405 RepID=UPI002E1E13D2|nr:BppU family phage baseplate upper protein [Bacillus mycoides]MED1054245.1 BppU family phage baseplate upper protein [Bacillus mycoides]
MKTRLILDINKTQYAQLNSIVTGRVGDKVSNTVDVYVVDGFVPYNLTGSDVYFECAKPDNTSVRDKIGITMIDVAKGHFEYTFPTQTFAAVGKSKQAYFTVEKNSTVKATTQDFIIVSLPDALTNRIPSQTYISQLEEMIWQLEQIQLDLLNSEAYREAHDAKTFAEQAKTISESVQEQLNTIVIKGDSSVEAAQARVDANGNAYNTLKERIDSNIISIDKQINDIGKNVKSFGAKGDGMTDDTKAIQSIISQGGNIMIPDGTFICGTIAIPSNTHIKGSANTIIKFKPGSGVKGFYSTAMFINANFPTYKSPSATDRETVVGLNENITIENITFDALNNPVYGLQFITCDYIKVKNCKIINAEGALDLRSVRYSYFNVECDNIKEDGISVTDQNFKAPKGAIHKGLSTRITFDNCVVKNSCTINGEGSSSMNAFEMDDGPSNIEYINCKAINNRGCGFEVHIHVPEFDLQNIRYINCIAIDNYPDEANPTRQVGGFAVGQTPAGSKMGNITFENCTSLGSPNAFCRLPGTESGSHFNVTINGGTWQSLQAPSDRVPEKSTCIFVGKLFKDMKIIGASIGGAVDGYGIYSHTTGDGLIMENCSFRDTYTPIRAGHTGGSLNISNVDIIPGNPVGATGTACVYITVDRVNIANMALTVDSSKYSSHMIRLINAKSASVSAIVNNTGTIANGCFQTQDCGAVTITGSAATGFTNGVQFSGTSQAVVVVGNNFKGCTNKFNSTPVYLTETGNAI